MSIRMKKPLVASSAAASTVDAMEVIDASEAVSSKRTLCVEDISTFFQASSRDKNDATNHIREEILKVIDQPPHSFLESAEYGPLWRTVHEAWKNALKQIADQTGIPAYTSVKTTMKGGRRWNYDADVSYYNGSQLVASRKIEFKNGGTDIGDLPQFLSLQAKFGLFPETYDAFWYDHCLDHYLACDPEITQPKPSREIYLKKVTGTTYTALPFFHQLKNREMFFQPEKNAVVNASITAYLTQYGHTIDIAAFSKKVQDSQANKMYLLWSNGAFCLDTLTAAEMTGMAFHSIQNGNVLELKAGTTSYRLLLRWRNHKGILNPAWQISMKR